MSEFDPKWDSHRDSNSEATNFKWLDAIPSQDPPKEQVSPIVTIVTMQADAIIVHSDFSSY
jgi:hypothetical protein